MEQRPVFIGGLPKSGKTPLRMLLSAQPHLALVRHAEFWTRFYNRFGDLGREANLERCLAGILQREPVQALAPDPERIRREFWEGRPTYARLFGLFYQRFAEQAGKARGGEQLTFVEQYADPIMAGYPGARMIHMIRLPQAQYAAATAASRRGAGRAGWALAAWRHSVRLGERNLRRYPDRYLLLRYESLTAQPVETLQQVCTFLGEEYVPVTVPEGNGAGGDPKRSLSEAELCFIQNGARKEMLVHGYGNDLARRTPDDWLRYYLLDWPANLAGVVAWHALNEPALGGGKYGD